MRSRTAAMLVLIAGQCTQLAFGQACDWSGVWDTTYAELTMYQNARYVTGVYPGWDSGRIEGTLSEDGLHLDGFWYESPTYAPPSDTGPLEFHLAQDCNSFTGQWGYDSSEGYIAGWSGTRTGPIPETDADALAIVSGGGLSVDGVPVGDNSAVPLQQDVERIVQAVPGSNRSTRLQTRCNAFENPVFAIIEDLSHGELRGIEEGEGLFLLVKIVTDRVTACQDLGLRSPAIASPTIVEVRTDGGISRVTNLLSAFSTQASTPLLGVSLAGQGSVILGHDSGSERSVVWAVDAALTVTPTDSSLPSFTLQPDESAVIDESGLGVPIVAPLFQSTFEEN